MDSSTNAFFEPAMTPPVSDNFASDPRIRYDRLSGRWFIVMIDVPAQNAITSNRVMIAVSSGPLIAGAASFTYYYFQHDQVAPIGDSGAFADYPTLGIDANVSMLRVAATLLREGRLRYARRRVGLVYDRRDLALDVAGRALTDFWCCDAAALPFDDATFAAATALNVVDCVAAPRELVAEAARVVAGGGAAVFATPYDWAPGATPVEQWLGGHSQRGPDAGASEPVLRAVLAAHGFEIVAEDEVAWRLRLHERSCVEYDVHVVLVRNPDPLGR